VCGARARPELEFDYRTLNTKVTRSRNGYAKNTFGKTVRFGQYSERYRFFVGNFRNIVRIQYLLQAITTGLIQIHSVTNIYAIIGPAEGRIFKNNRVFLIVRKIELSTVADDHRKVPKTL